MEYIKTVKSENGQAFSVMKTIATENSSVIDIYLSVGKN